MGTVSWASGGGPLAGYAAGYRRELERCGFSPRAVRGHLEVMGQLSRWLAAERLTAADLAVAWAGQFFAARRAVGSVGCRRCRRWPRCSPICRISRSCHWSGLRRRRLKSCLPATAATWLRSGAGRR
jgi:glutathione S-transferase